MAKQNQTTLKGYFETGDVPNQNQYGDLIDSNLNLAETGIIITAGTISSSGFISENDLNVKGHITASGAISSSGAISASGVSAVGTITGVSGSFSNLSSTSNLITVTDQIKFQSSVTASIISASGHISCSGLIIAGSEIRGSGGDFTASGTIKAAGFVGPLTTTGITSTGPGVFTTINTGQGATEVHLMDQNVREADAVTFVTINTGQGATEVHLMNQNLTNTSNVTFNQITLNKSSATGGQYGGTINSSGQSFTLTLTSCPEILGRGENVRSEPTTIINTSVKISSVVLATVASAELSVNAFKVEAEKFQISLGNESAEPFGGGDVTINFTIF